MTDATLRPPISHLADTKGGVIPMSSSPRGPDRADTLPGWRTGAILALWFAVAVIGNLTGIIWPAPDRAPIGLLFAIVVPPLLFCGAYRFVPAVRQFVLTLDLRLLTAIQCWRVVGATFIVLHAHRLLPGLFAYPAGYGDLLTGLFAPFALLALIRQRTGWQRHLFRLNLLGLVDFAGAISTGLLASNGPLGLLRGEISTVILQQLPLSLIPTFGVPFWIIVHIAALLQLHHLHVAEREETHRHASTLARG